MKPIFGQSRFSFPPSYLLGAKIKRRDVPRAHTRVRPYTSVKNVVLI